MKTIHITTKSHYGLATVIFPATPEIPIPLTTPVCILGREKCLTKSYSIKSLKDFLADLMTHPMKLCGSLFHWFRPQNSVLSYWLYSKTVEVPEACWSLELAIADLAWGQTRVYLISGYPLFYYSLKCNFCLHVLCSADLGSTQWWFCSGSQEKYLTVQHFGGSWGSTPESECGPF